LDRRLHNDTRAGLQLQRALELPVLLEILLNHLLDGIGTWAKGISGLPTETLLDKVVKSVFLLIS